MKVRALALLSVITVAVAVYTSGCCCCGPGVPTDTGGVSVQPAQGQLDGIINATKPIVASSGQVAQKY
jgi:hypothetical protein